MTSPDLAVQTAPAPSVDDVRRALLAQADGFDERRATHQANMHADGKNRCDAYEGLVCAAVYGRTLAGVLGQLNRRPSLRNAATALADVVADVMAHGDRALADANDDVANPANSTYGDGRD